MDVFFLLIASLLACVNILSSISDFYSVCVLLLHVALCKALCVEGFHVRNRNPAWRAEGSCYETTQYVWSYCVALHACEKCSQATSCTSASSDERARVARVSVCVCAQPKLRAGTSDCRWVAGVGVVLCYGIIYIRGGCLREEQTVSHPAANGD